MTDGTGLDVHDLSKRFGEVVALDGMSFGLERGGLVGFLGPNGSGKTTMRSIMGLLHPDSGVKVREALRSAGDVGVG
jgi:ABC-2 type transport system ATP-binding protein